LRSNPAAKLKWYINGEEADPAILKNHQVIKEQSGLETSILGLTFKVREKHFKTGDMKLKCTATIATIYWRSNEESVQGVRKQNAFVSESRGTWDSAAIPIRSSANRRHWTSLNFGGFLIYLLFPFLSFLAFNVVQDDGCSGVFMPKRTVKEQTAADKKNIRQSTRQPFQR
jgi:hypothetical protein